MESRIAAALNLKYHPVAVIRAEEKPENAMQFKKGKWSCVMFLFANAAKTIAGIDFDLDPDPVFDV